MRHRRGNMNMREWIETLLPKVIERLRKELLLLESGSRGGRG